MLQIYLILLLSVFSLTFNDNSIIFKKANATTLNIFPKKRPIDLFLYEESLSSIYQIIEKEGGKRIGELKNSRIKNGENLSEFLERVGFKPSQINKIINSIRKNYKSKNILRKIPTGHLVRYSLPKFDLGGGLEFKFNKKKDIYVWQDYENNFITKVTKRPLKKDLSFKTGEIKTNLYNAFKISHIPKKTFYEMVSILGFSIDFQRDIRVGDSFEVLYSKETDLLENIVIDTDPPEYLGVNLSGKKIAFYRYKLKSGFTSYFDKNGQSSKKTLMKTPLNGARLSSGYGNRKHPILGYTKMHKGLDFAAPSGTPVFAAGDGVIEKAGWNGNYGKYIRIRHNGTYKTAYAHLSKITKKMYTKVIQGEIIGYVGNTGMSSGPHLHYEVLISGKQVNPVKIKLPAGKNISKNELSDFKKHVEKINRDIHLVSKSRSGSHSIAYYRKRNNDQKNKIN